MNLFLFSFLGLFWKILMHVAEYFVNIFIEGMIFFLWLQFRKENTQGKLNVSLLSIVNPFKAAFIHIIKVSINILVRWVIVLQSFNTRNKENTSGGLNVSVSMWNLLSGNLMRLRTQSLVLRCLCILLLFWEEWLSSVYSSHTIHCVLTYVLLVVSTFILFMLHSPFHFVPVFLDTNIPIRIIFKAAEENI